MLGVSAQHLTEDSADDSACEITEVGGGTRAVPISSRWASLNMGYIYGTKINGYLMLF